MSDSFESQLLNYNCLSVEDAESQERCFELLSEPDAFERSRLVGHFTGSALVIDLACKKVLLTHHKKLDRWLQLGGHCDGIKDPFFTAWKEAYEESGLKYLEPLSNSIVDIDIHVIPSNKAIPRHLHYDIRYCFQAKSNETLNISDESHSLSWVDISDLDAFSIDYGLKKLIEKAAPIL